MSPLRPALALAALTSVLVAAPARGQIAPPPEPCTPIPGTTGQVCASFATPSVSVAPDAARLPAAQTAPTGGTTGAQTPGRGRPAPANVAPSAGEALRVRAGRTAPAPGEALRVGAQD